MDEPKIAYEKIEGYEDVIRIPLGNINDTQFVYDVLKDTFDACFESGNTKFIVDLENIKYPTSSLIALLIEVSSRARRLNGDVKIINLSKSAKNNFMSFSPLSYLSLESDEALALRDFKNHSEQNVGPILTDEQESENFSSEYANLEETEADIEISNTLFSSADIVEDPIIEKLQDRYEQATEEPETQNQAFRKGERNHLKVESSAANLYAICDFVTDYATRAGFDVKEVGKIKIAVYEASLNVIEHAYHSNPDNWIDVWIEYNADMFKIIIQDYGVGFEGFSEQKYDVMSAMDGRKTGGFGLYIISRSMDQLDYRPDPKHGNRLTMIKFLPNEANKKNNQEKINR